MHGNLTHYILILIASLPFIKLTTETVDHFTTLEYDIFSKHSQHKQSFIIQINLKN